MRRPPRPSSLLPLALILSSVFCGHAAAQDEKPKSPYSRPDRTIREQSITPRPDNPNGAAGGLTREQMWRAPTKEEWAKPVQIQWQRTWDDALAVQRETRKPILICVNMDGEIASEHYAGVRYRDPEIAKLYEPYICVIASTYRHNPRDHDEQGHRIECPRFGGVTCGEHIAIEPLLFERYFEGERIAPRHIMVEVDGVEAWDVLLAFDTASVFQQIKEGIENREIQPEPIVRGDRTIIERVASRDAVDREAVEKAFAEGDEKIRQAILEAAMQNPDAAPEELLRLAVFGLDSDQAKLAREALAKSEQVGAVDVIAEALRVPMAAEERKSLVAALRRQGKKDARARKLSIVYSGLDGEKSTVDASEYVTSLKGSAYPPPIDWDTVEGQLALAEKAVKQKPDDAATQLRVALAKLAYLRDPETKRRLARNRRTEQAITNALLDESMAAARKAQELGSEDWRADAAIALVQFRRNNTVRAYQRAERVIEKLPAGDTSYESMALLGMYADSLRTKISMAVRRQQDWPPQWMTDMHSTYSVLGQHPLGTAGHVTAHVDFLFSLDARAKAMRVLQEGLQRFTDDSGLHERLRRLVLRDRGVNGLLSVYERLLAEEGATPDTRWYAGYAQYIAAEYHRRANDAAAAKASYDKAQEFFDQFCEERPEQRPSADHYVAMVMGGRARLAFEADELEQSVSELLNSFARSKVSANVLDGMNLSPVDTAKQVRVACRAAGREDLAERITQAFKKLDPEQLQLPAFERVGSRPSTGTGVRRGGR